jgi:hypothetical protein
MSLNGKTIKTFIANFQYSTLLIAMFSSCGALWLNSQYVAKAAYEKDRQILILRVDNLEMETKSIRFLLNDSQQNITELTIVLSKIERLISKLISDDGDIILTREMKQLEIDIAEIKKDISYIRDAKLQIKRDINDIRGSRK